MSDRASGRPVKLPLKVISLTILLTAVCYLVLAVFAEFEAVIVAIGSLSVSIYLGLLGLSLVSYTMRFMRWWFFLHPFQPTISLFLHLRIYLAAFALTVTPAKVGETVRSLYLSPLGVAYPVSLAAFVSERLCDVVAVSLLALLSLGAVAQSPLILVVPLIVFIVALFLLRSRLIDELLLSYSQRRFGMVAVSFYSAMKRFLSRHMLSRVFPVSVLAWLSQGILLVVIVRALDFDCNASVVIGIYCLSILAGAASFIPGGLGATEAAISVLLGAIGMPPGSAVAAAIVSRIMTLWLAMLLGVLALLKLHVEPIKSEQR